MRRDAVIRARAATAPISLSWLADHSFVTPVGRSRSQFGCNGAVRERDYGPESDPDRILLHGLPRRHSPRLKARDVTQRFTQGWLIREA
jgi:hypothetical protein